MKHLRDGGDTVTAVLTSVVTKEPPKRGPLDSDAQEPADEERQSQRESHPVADEGRALPDGRELLMDDTASPLAIEDAPVPFDFDLDDELIQALTLAVRGLEAEETFPLDEVEEESISEWSYADHDEEIGVAVLNENTGKYHRESEGQARAARCGRGKGELLVLHIDTFRSIVSSRADSPCCEICFPPRSRASKITRCLHICGVCVGDAFCSNRCDRLHASADPPKEGEWTRRCSDHGNVLDPFVGTPLEVELLDAMAASGAAVPATIA